MIAIIMMMIIILISASQLLFIFINSEDEEQTAVEIYKFEVAKLKSEDINVFRLGDKFPTKSTYKVDIRKGVI